MGFLKEKYTKDYFLGGTDPSTGKEFGVRGFESFRVGRVHITYTRHMKAALKVLGTFEGKDLLDVGCGRGELETLLLELGPRRVVGIDFGPAALEICRKFVDDPRLELHEMEAKDMPWRQEFDAVFMGDVIEHIPASEHDPVLERVRAALRENGVLVMYTPMYTSPQAKDDSDSMPSTSGMHCNKQTFSTLDGSLRRHGLIPVSFYRRRWVIQRTEDVSWATKAVCPLKLGYQRLKWRIFRCANALLPGFLKGAVVRIVRPG